MGFVQTCFPGALYESTIIKSPGGLTMCSRFAKHDSIWWQRQERSVRAQQAQRCGMTSMDTNTQKLYSTRKLSEKADECLNVWHARWHNKQTGRRTILKKVTIDPNPNFDRFIVEKIVIYSFSQNLPPIALRPTLLITQGLVSSCFNWVNLGKEAFYLFSLTLLWPFDENTIEIVYYHCIHTSHRLDNENVAAVFKRLPALWTLCWHWEQTNVTSLQYNR